jgi:ubiquitin-activating enzyme E1 C
LKKASIRSEAKSLYIQFPPGLEEATRPNLKRKLEELLTSGEEIAVTDPAFQIAFRYRVAFKS